jgi:hypothetical protein
LAVVACTACLLGCRSSSNEQYTPSEQLSRNALVAALDQWKSGDAIAFIKGDPSVQIVDSTRQREQRLLAYDIISDESLDVGRRYRVKVQLENPAAEQTLQFIVVGIDPLLVFRQEDYDMLAHWDMAMPAPEAESSQSAPSDVP